MFDWEQGKTGTGVKEKERRESLTGLKRKKIEEGKGEKERE